MRPRELAMNAPFIPGSCRVVYAVARMSSRPSRLAASLGALLALVLAPARAGEARGDHDHARVARARGEVLPLARILALVERDFAGRVIDVELDREDGMPRYEIELLLADGRVIELELDARTGELLQIEGTRLETAFRPRPR